MDRLAMQQEKLRGDYELLWRWADQDAAPVLKQYGPSARPEAPSLFQLLENRVELLEIDLAELAHELKRTAAALEKLQERLIPVIDATTGQPRLRYHEEQRAAFRAPRCHDCGAWPGELHSPGCDVEECPRCHGQIITCGCEREGSSSGASRQ